MKKYLVTLAVTALATAAFAQGTVTFQNNNLGWAKSWTSPTDSTLKNIPVGGGIVQLLAAPAGTSLTPLGTYGTEGFTANYSTLTAFLSANPGWNAIATTGIPTIAGLFSAGGQTLTGVAAGANADYIIIGWSGTFANYDSAFAGSAFLGTSALRTTGTGGAGSPPSLAVNLNTTFTGLTIAPQASIVPEPSTFALAGLGAAALLIFRRRK